MSFNTQLSGNGKVDLKGDRQSKGMFDSNTRQTGVGIGTIPSQPVLDYAKLQPVIPYFIQHTYNAQNNLEKIPPIDNVTSIGLSQIVIDGLPTGTALYLAINFEGSSNDLSLESKGIHNLPTVPKGAIVVYYTGTGTAVASFGGEPIVLWQKRTSADFKCIRIDVVDSATGLPVVYNKFNMWMFAKTINWQI